MFYNFMVKTSAGAELKIGLKISARSTRPKFPMSLVIFLLELGKVYYACVKRKQIRPS